MSTADIEADLCGLAIIEPSLTNVDVRGEQFSEPVLGGVWDAVRSLHARGIQPDPAGVVEAARPIRVDYAQVVDLIGRPGVAVNVPMYAERIVDGWRRRTIATALTRASGRLDSDETTDTVVTELMQAIDHNSEAEQLIEETLTLDEFMAQELPANDWIVPDLLTRGDRLILTGSEGAGKTYLMRQFAVCTAAGLHPFTEAPMTPKRVLVIDAENPLRIMHGTFGKLRNEVMRRGLKTSDRLWIHRFPQGIDLAKASDRLKLHGLVRTFRPDLLIIGPAYKLYVGGSNSREEDLARQVTTALDGLREEFGFALILEHHSPHGAPGMERSVRPIGSSLWMRWPEFGIGIRLESATPGHRTASVHHWRGPRDERAWPERLETGRGLPWVEAVPSDVNDRSYP